MKRLQLSAGAVLIGRANHERTGHGDRSRARIQPRRTRSRVFGTFACLLVAVIASMLLSACQRDPAKRKQELMLAAKDYLKAGKVSEAILSYRQVIQIDPNDGNARLKLAETYATVNDLEKAFAEYVRAADLLPNNVEAQIKASESLLRMGHYEDAAARADGALRLDPKSIPARLQKGNALAGLKDIAGATREMEEAIRTDPSKVVAYASLGTLQSSAGDQVRAEKTFKSAVTMDPTSIPARLALANFYWSVKRNSDVEAQLKEALAIRQDDLLTNRALAVFLLNSGRQGEAEEPLKVVAAGDVTGEGKLTLADYYANLQRTAEARSILQGLRSRPEFATQASLRLAYLGLTSDHDKEGAYRLLEEVLKREPRNVDALSGKAQLLINDRKLDDAVKVAQAAVAADPASFRAQYILGMALNRRGDTAGATTAYRAALQANSSFVLPMLELSQLALSEGNVSVALQMAQAAVQALPTFPDAHLALARALLAKGDYAGAAKPMTSLSASFPDEPLVQVEVGRLFLANGDRAGARKAFDRALLRDPSSVGALRGLAVLDMAAKEPELARKRVEKALQAYPQRPDLQLLAAQIFSAVGDSVAAEKAARQSITLDPKNFAAYSVLVQVLLKGGRLPDAIASFDELSKKQPNSVATHTAVAILLQLQNKLSEAEARYKQALAIDANAPVAANNLAQIYADRSEHLDEALQLAQAARSSFPDALEVIDTLGWVYYKKNLPSLAIPLLEDCVKKAPKNPTYSYHLGLAYLRAGQVKKAREVLKHSLELSPKFDGSDEARRVLQGLS